MKHFDIVLDNNDEILIENGDFVISESTLQHIKMYMNLNSGELRRFPSIGANMLSYRGELNDFYRIINHIDTQLRSLQYEVIDTTIGTDGIIKITLSNGITVTV